jgi:hypothetical protein
VFEILIAVQERHIVSDGKNRNQAIVNRGAATIRAEVCRKSTARDQRHGERLSNSRSSWAVSSPI